ncbi:MAG: Large-conductance mechanosensitive channel [Candidatus Magasanikbacteria bacterium GW2011_GWA2_43_9]|nr:MAG: Large-conductance mechanosensitive channel [Candidatus Magasanikbacteria bacterium GW2011_GWA2_43_9]
MKKFLEEFKSFAMRGNVVDLAIGVVIGGAFGKIVTSLVNDIILPPIGKLLGGVDFTNLFITFGDETYDTLSAAQEAGVATWNYGLFINTILDFIIVALAIFILIKQMNKLKKKALYRGRDSNPRALTGGRF